MPIKKKEQAPVSSKNILSKYTNRISLNNAKCKRKHNLIRKCMFLSKLCEQQILLVIYDKKCDKITKYTSHDDFDVSDAS